jgi:REP element-mobilizing transposase RayT
MRINPHAKNDTGQLRRLNKFDPEEIMPYWRLFYHIVWTTRDRHPWITANIEDFAYRVLTSKCEEKVGQVFAINGLPDHIHVVTSIPPSISVASFVKHIKGASSYAICAEFDMPFAWRRGYGAFSISERNLQKAIEYVVRQKEHHNNGTVIAALERTTEDDKGVRPDYSGEPTA